MPRTRRRTFTAISDLDSHPEAYCEVEALANYWKVATQTVRKWIRDGSLPAAKFGRVRRVRTIDARDFDRRCWPATG